MKAEYLLDTNLLSEIVKKAPGKAVLAKLRKIPQEKLATSAICITELRFGTARHPRGQDIWARLSREILSHLQVLAVDDAVALRAGDVLADLAERGLPIGMEDVLIGTTALVHGLTVVTRNTRHFSRIGGLNVENWWE